MRTAQLSRQTRLVVAALMCAALGSTLGFAQSKPASKPASVAGKFGFPLRSPYSASKWAVVGFSRGLSIELGPHKIRVNSILPGVVDGERIKQVFTARAASKGISYDEMQRQALASASLGTMVTHEEIAEMILYITSPVGRSITGQSLSICGGMEWLI